jgi:hypothetical protein
MASQYGKALMTAEQIFKMVTTRGYLADLPNVNTCVGTFTNPHLTIDAKGRVTSALNGGAAGPKGDQGKTGPAGVKGDTGPVGAKGPQGLQGATGDGGARGPEGPAPAPDYRGLVSFDDAKKNETIHGPRATVTAGSALPAGAPVVLNTGAAGVEVVSPPPSGAMPLGLFGVTTAAAAARGDAVTVALPGAFASARRTPVVSRKDGVAVAVPFGVALYTDASDPTKVADAVNGVVVGYAVGGDSGGDKIYVHLRR